MHIALEKRDHEAIALSSQTGCRFAQTAKRIEATAILDECLLHYHRAQLGVALTEDALWLVAAPLVDLAILFPEPKQPFNVLACLNAFDHLHQRGGWRGEDQVVALLLRIKQVTANEQEVSTGLWAAIQPSGSLPSQRDEAL